MLFIGHWPAPGCVLSDARRGLGLVFSTPSLPLAQRQQERRLVLDEKVGAQAVTVTWWATLGYSWSGKKGWALPSYSF